MNDRLLVDIHRASIVVWHAEQDGRSEFEVYTLIFLLRRSIDYLHHPQQKVQQLLRIPGTSPRVGLQRRSDRSAVWQDCGYLLFRCMRPSWPSRPAPVIAPDVFVQVLSTHLVALHNGCLRTADHSPVQSMQRPFASVKAGVLCSR